MCRFRIPRSRATCQASAAADRIRAAAAFVAARKRSAARAAGSGHGSPHQRAKDSLYAKMSRTSEILKGLAVPWPRHRCQSAQTAARVCTKQTDTARLSVHPSTNACAHTRVRTCSTCLMCVVNVRACLRACVHACTA